MSLEEQPITNDEIYQFDDLKLLIQPRDQVYFNQTKLDYVKDPLGNGTFKLIQL